MTESDRSADDETLATILRERREFLAGLAATTGGLFAGCTGDSDGGTSTEADTPTETVASTDEETPTETGTPTATATPASVDPPRPDPAAYEASPAVPPEEALDTFKTLTGADVDLVASEPLIYSPVDVQWDARGRMWVVEMPDYMGVHPGDGKGGKVPGSYGDWGEADMSREEMTGFGDAGPDQEPTGRIVVLEDPDNDGRMEEATVFQDGLTLPRSIAFTGDGVLVGLPGRIVHYEYDDETLEKTRREVVHENYAPAGGPNDNPEHTDNGLLRGLDNWLYNAKSDIRLRYEDGELIEEDTHFRGQWGITKDSSGRLYYTTNSTWLFADLVPGNGEYLLRGGSNSNSGIGEIPGDAGDPSVYAVRENYGTNRAYGGGYHRDDGRMKTITGVAGPGIYRGDLLPFGGSAFVPDPSGNVVAQFDVSEEPGGLDIDTSHRLYDDGEWGQREFLGSTNEVFRPITTKTGPDGALYIVDMYKGIFQHVRFLSDYLAEYILENDLHKVPPSGRIYRIAPQGEDGGAPALAERSPSELADALEHPNGWVRDTAQRLLVDNDLTEGVEAVREVARTSGRPIPRVHALWTLHGMGRIDLESVVAAMETGHARVRQAAIRTGEALLGTEDAPDYVDRVATLATTANQDQRVVVQAAYSLGEVSSPNLQSVAEDALGTVRDVYGDDQYVADAIDSAPEIDA